MPPFFVWIAAAAGTFSAAKWIVRESRRINAILYPEPFSDVEAAHAGPHPTGRLRPGADGIYRPE